MMSRKSGTSGSYEIIQKEFGDGHGRTRAALGRFIKLYEARGDDRAALVELTTGPDCGKEISDRAPACPS